MCATGCTKEAGEVGFKTPIGQCDPERLIKDDLKRKRRRKDAIERARVNVTSVRNYKRLMGLCANCSIMRKEETEVG
jgi:hypothetical protein